MPDMSLIEGRYPRTFHRFVSRPDIDAPVWVVREYQNESVLAPGYWFVACYKGLNQEAPGPDWVGPHIYDTDGELVWAGGSAFNHWNMFDFRVAKIGTEQVLTLVSNHAKTAQAYILDNQYQLRRSIPLVTNHDDRANMHEFLVRDNGERALMMTSHPSTTPYEDTPRFNGSCSVEYEGFRELDLQTHNAQTLFEWNAKDWIGLEESTYRTYDGTTEALCSKGWDFLHLNSVEKFADGDYLVSARHTDAIYKISHFDGHIVWRLGGLKSNFRMLNNSTFSRQHHAQPQQQNESHVTIALFDNALGDGPFTSNSYEYSRGLVLLLDLQEMTADVLEEYPHPNAHRVNARGSLQSLPNGNTFICWAYASRISEHTPDGKLAMQAVFSVDADSYRGFKYPWIGLPLRPPDIHTQAVWNGNDILTIFHVSWNGATEVSQWHFKTLSSPSAVLLGVAERHSFETRFLHQGFVPDVFAEAYDRDGQFLGRSDVHHTALPSVMGEDSVSKAKAQPPSPHTWYLTTPLFPILLVTVCAVIFWIILVRSKRHRSKRWYIMRLPTTGRMHYIGLRKDCEDKRQ